MDEFSKHRPAPQKKQGSAVHQETPAPRPRTGPSPCHPSPCAPPMTPSTARQDGPRGLETAAVEDPPSSAEFSQVPVRCGPPAAPQSHRQSRRAHCSRTAVHTHDRPDTSSSEELLVCLHVTRRVTVWLPGDRLSGQCSSWVTCVEDGQQTLEEPETGAERF